MANEQFKGQTSWDGVEWTVKLYDTDESYAVSATSMVDEATARTAAKSALEQKYIDDTKAVPAWLTA